MTYYDAYRQWWPTQPALQKSMTATGLERTQSQIELAANSRSAFEAGWNAALETRAEDLPPGALGRMPDDDFSVLRIDVDGRAIPPKAVLMALYSLLSLVAKVRFEAPSISEQQEELRRLIGG